jgi:DNA repair exonuclease SbcCD ATPase subunit
MMQKGKEVVKRLDETERKLKAIENRIKERPKVMVLSYYEDRLKTVNEELAGIEKIAEKIRKYGVEKPEKIEKGLKDAIGKKEKLKKELEGAEKKLEGIKKEKDKKKQEKKISEINEKIRVFDEKIMVLEKRKEVANIDINSIKIKKEGLTEEKEELTAKIMGLKGGETLEGKKCNFCGAYFTGDRCPECGARFVGVSKGGVIKKAAPIAKYGIVFFLLGLLMIIIGWFVFGM